MPKMKPDSCCQTVLLDRSISKGQKLAKNAKNETFKVIFIFQTVLPETSILIDKNWWKMPKIKLSNERFLTTVFLPQFAKKFSKCVTLFYYFQSTFVLVPNNQNKFWTFPNSILTRISRLNPVKPKLILAVEDPAILWWFSFLNYGRNLMNQISSFLLCFQDLVEVLTDAGSRWRFY